MSQIQSDKQLLQSLNDKFDVLIDIVRGLSAVTVGAPVSLAPAPCQYALYAWLDEWYTTYKVPNCKPNTLSSIDVAIRVHIKPNLPDIALNLLQGIEIQKFLTALNMSRTRKIVHDVLNASLKDALGVGIIERNPMQGVKIPVHKREQGKALDGAEIVAFKKAIAGHVLENYFLFLLYTGCRRCEGLSLNKTDIDRKNKVLHIRGTKTANADRTIPLFENIASLTARILPNKDGFYFNFRPDYVTRIFKRFCPAHKLHDLRHTFATTCLAAKIPLKVVQIWLGHADIDTTANIYSHVTKEINTAEADVLNDYLTKKDTLKECLI